MSDETSSSCGGYWAGTLDDRTKPETSEIVNGDDEALARLCLKGDEFSQRAFVDQFQGLVLSVCWKMLGHRQDAEDVAQEVFVRAFRHLEHWDQERPLKPWLLMIAVNRCRTALERRSKLPRLRTQNASS